MTDLDRRAQQVFQEALDRDSAERAAFVTAACHGDERLREQVDTLLAALDGASGFLADQRAPAERPGVTIDRYKLLEEIGEGGFGVVWMAQQLEPVRRRVAVKVIKLGMDTRQVVARFEAERQALALMDHPNIARVLDGGSTEAGRPYFVMELVRGVPITDYCDRVGLSTANRLDLFCQVCAAVQHAHHKGVVHRDIKPSNILVTEQDGAAVPKVIDFGIAKATDQELTRRTLFTGFRQMIGTPEYMAPEQAGLSGVDVDTRADVYSLGVLLYEILTGTKPFDIGDVAKLGYDEVLRRIRDVDPPKPSTRLSTLGDRLTTVAQRRCIAPDQLGRLLRGDLDWVVMRALAKDRGRRYQTAAALAEDVRRYLDDLPVEAGPPGAAYRVRKFVTRHRGVVATMVAVALALVCGIVGVLLALDRAVRAERDAVTAARRADEAAARARREQAIAEQVLELTHEMLASADPHASRGPDYRLRDLLDAFGPSVAGRFAAEPAIEGALRLTVGVAYRGIGDKLAAEEHLERARELLAAGGESSPMALRARRQWAWLQHDVGRFQEALDELDAALAVAEDEGERLLLDHARADVLRHLGRLDDAEAISARQLEDAGTADPRAALDALESLGLVARQRGDLATAERRFAAAERLLDDPVFGTDPSRRPKLMLCRAAVTYDQRRYDEAERLFERARAELAECVGEDSIEVAECDLGLGRIHKVRRRYDEAERAIRASLAIRDRMQGPRAAQTVATRAELAGVLALIGRRPEAIEIMEECAAAYGRIYGEDSLQMANARNDLAIMLRDEGRYPEAAALLRAALDKHLEHLGPGHVFTARVRINLGGTLARAKDHAAAEAQYQAVADNLEDTPDLPLSHRVAVLLELGRARANQGRWAESVEPYRRAIEAGENDPARAQQVGWARCELGFALGAFDRWAEAEAELRAAFETGGERENELLRRTAAERLADLHARWQAAEPDGGHAEHAATWRARAAVVGK